MTREKHHHLGQLDTEQKRRSDEGRRQTHEDGNHSGEHKSLSEAHKDKEEVGVRPKSKGEGERPMEKRRRKADGGPTKEGHEGRERH